MDFDGFEWAEAKCLSNIEKHGIDFEDAATIFDRPYFTKPSSHESEE